MSTSEPRRAYHHGNLREALIEIGLETLEASLGAEPSLRDLARRAGVSPNAVYRHFSDKDALLAALAAEGFRLLRDEADAADARVEPGDAQGLLRAYGLSYVRAAVRRPALFRLMFGRFVAGAHDAELAAAKSLMFERLRSRVAGHSGIPLDDPRVESGTLYAWSLVHGLANLALDGQIDGDLEARAEAVLTLAGSPRQAEPRTAPS